MRALIRRILASSVIALGMGIVAVFNTPFPIAGNSKLIPTLRRGKYLVESVAICSECHSERDFSKPGWPIPPGRVGGSRVLSGEGTSEPVVAPNISPDTRMVR
jgi:hypothetical protein